MTRLSHKGEVSILLGSWWLDLLSGPIHCQEILETSIEYMVEVSLEVQKLMFQQSHLKKSEN
jgi:hypothetical protein